MATAAARTSFNPSTRKDKVKQRDRGWSRDEQGRIVVECECGVRVVGLLGDPQVWCDRHVCSPPTSNTSGGWV